MLYNDEKSEGEGKDMKRFLVVLLAMSMAMSAICSFASEIDLESFSIEELVALRSEIDFLLIDQDCAPIPYGVYTAGSSLPLGSYEIFIIPNNGDQGEVGGHVCVTGLAGGKDGDVIYFDVTNSSSAHVDMTEGTQMWLTLSAYHKEGQFYIKRCTIFPPEEAENSEEP